MRRWPPILQLFAVLSLCILSTGQARLLLQSDLPPCPPGQDSKEDPSNWKCIPSWAINSTLSPSPSPRPPSPSPSPAPVNTGVDVHARCPDGCQPGYCILHSAGGYKCEQCRNNMIVNKTDGTCGCPAGSYSISNYQCADCPRGSVCPGGPYGATDRLGCGANMTTTGRRVASNKGCINTPGTSFRYKEDGTPVAEECPADTWSAGMKKQRSCVPCPAGLTTNGKTGANSPKACDLPSGYFLRGPGIVAACPQGEYKVGSGAAGSCQKCPFGVTTRREASASIAACTVLLPGFAPINMTGGYIAETIRCPQKYYCPGGQAVSAFNFATPDATDGTTIVRCPASTWTKEVGASSRDQCMVPPGHEISPQGVTRECPDGTYRAEWVIAGPSATCASCGEGFSSQATDEIFAYAFNRDLNQTTLPVRSTGSSCYARAGQGIYYSSASNTYKVQDCGTGTYGLPNATFGLMAFPCRDCPAGLTTTTAYPASAKYYVEYAPGRGGFTDPKACVTMPGHWYSGRKAERCPAGSWAEPGAGACTQCDYGLSTAYDPWLQGSAADCKLAPGFGFHDGVIQACPIGTYNNQLRDNRTTPCTPCPTGLSTSQTGGLSLEDCNVAALGYGTPVGSSSAYDTPCGGPSTGTYGPAARPAGSTCVSCPAQNVGYSFDYLAENQVYQPTVVARLYASSPADCINEFNQVMDAAWQMGGSAAMTPVSSATASTWEQCVAACRADSSCQYVTFDYQTSACSKRVAKTGSDLIAYKAMVAGDTSAASVKPEDSDNSAVAYGLASGSYTFWPKDDATGIGATSTVTPAVSSVGACLSLCDADRECAAAVMTGVTSADAAPAECRLIKGDSSVGVFKRSMTRTVVDRLSRASIA